MFSLLIVLFAVLGFGLSLFLIVLLLVNPKSYQNIDNDAPIIIVKIVESCRENLPLNSAHGWSLTLCSGNLRCWKKEFAFRLLGAPVTVYACSKEINCAAVILLNVIADVSTWSEWDIQVQDHIVHLELPEDPSLHGDVYMQCDQLVLTSSMLKADPEVHMYRFGNLESNGTGWILLWNAKYLDWVLYIAQPIDNEEANEFMHPVFNSFQKPAVKFQTKSETDDDDDDDDDSEKRCLLTTIWGLELNHPHKYNIPELLCSKISNIAEAIHSSQLKLRPFQSLLHTSAISNPHFPTIHSALNDLPKKPCVLLEHEKKEQTTLSPNKVLAVKPVSLHKPLTSKNISGFSLILCPLKKVSKLVAGDLAISDEKRKSRRRQKFRSDSISANFPRIKQLELENRRSSSLSTPIRKKPPELTVTQPDEDLKPPQRSSSHSFLGVFFQRRRSSDVSKHSRSPSPSRNSSSGRRNTFSFENTSSQEDFDTLCPNPDGSDVSDVEKSYQKISKSVQSDYKSLGEYSICAVLQENLKTSLIDINAPEDDQKSISGGWVYKEMCKDICVFKKTSFFDSCVVLSYLCKGSISSPLLDVWKTLLNPRTRFMYDDTVKRITVLSEYSNGQKLIHMYNESVTLLKKEVQDFCLLQTEKKEGNQYILGFHSVKDDNLCPAQDVTRGAVIASGWVLESSPNNTTQVSYLVQMLISSPEISTMEDISNTQCQCIHNLRIYLSSEPHRSFAQSNGSSC